MVYYFDPSRSICSYVRATLAIGLPFPKLSLYAIIKNIHTQFWGKYRSECMPHVLVSEHMDIVRVGMRYCLHELIYTQPWLNKTSPAVIISAEDKQHKNNIPCILLLNKNILHLHMTM